jgi:hypothetical protein
VGGGDSRLVDALLGSGISCVTVLDVASTALDRARQRLGPGADRVRWIQSDVADPGLTLAPVDLWHDRAVFHFLTDAHDRHRYVERLRATLKPGGSVVLATFALDGPRKCSGLPVVRYSSETLTQELGERFRLVTSEQEEHHTPGGGVQLFQWSRLVMAPTS